MMWKHTCARECVCGVCCACAAAALNPHGSFDSSSSPRTLFLLAPRSAAKFCTCEKPYVNKDLVPCAQESVSGLTTLLLTIFVGGVGFPWFYTAQGNQCQICCGVTKLLVGTFTFGIWALVDIIRVATNKHMGGGTELEGIIPLYPDL